MTINPNTSILWGSDFTARISPCEEVLTSELDTVGHFPTDTLDIDEGGNEYSRPFSQFQSDSITNFLNKTLISFPNPTNGLFAFSNTSESICKVEILNNRGVIMLETLILPKDEYTFDLTNFSNGSYILKITSGSKIVFNKIILIK